MNLLKSMRLAGSTLRITPSRPSVASFPMQRRDLGGSIWISTHSLLRTTAGESDLRRFKIHSGRLTGWHKKNKVKNKVKKKFLFAHPLNSTLADILADRQIDRDRGLVRLRARDWKERQKDGRRKIRTNREIKGQLVDKWTVKQTDEQRRTDEITAEMAKKANTN